MHFIQKQIMELMSSTPVLHMNLRQIGRDIGQTHPQKIKYHLEQLQKRRLIKTDLQNKKIIKIKNSDKKESSFIFLPIYGSANCGEACVIADDHIEGFIKISKNILGKFTKNIFALKAIGSSMNESNINGKSIESGDFTIIDKKQNIPKNGDYIASIIDECANIKRYYKDNDQIILISESNEEHFPIIIHETDPYLIVGKVVDIIKTPKIKF